MTFDEAKIKADYLTGMRKLSHVIDERNNVHMACFYDGKVIYTTTPKLQDDVKEIEPMVTKKGKKNNIVTEQDNTILEQENIPEL